MREVAAQFERPVLLFSGGKDSIVMFHLALKAFHPGRIPFPLMHVDTGHNFPETIAFRDELVSKYKVELIVGSVQESIDTGRLKEETGPDASRNALQTVTLLDTLKITRLMLPWVAGDGTRRKHEPKNAFFPIGTALVSGILKISDPSFGIFSMVARIWARASGYFRLSNWTEMDVWQYIARENIDIPNLILCS
jgi:sulfate adenylyltransferase subunit 2